MWKKEEVVLVVEALWAAELGEMGPALSPGVAMRFLDEVEEFRRAVEYASLKLIGRMAREGTGKVRARATEALALFPEGWEEEISDGGRRASRWGGGRRERRSRRGLG